MITEEDLTHREQRPQAAVRQAFTVTDGKTVAIDVLSDPERLRKLDLTVLDH